VKNKLKVIQSVDPSLKPVKSSIKTNSMANTLKTGMNKHLERRVSKEATKGEKIEGLVIDSQKATIEEGVYEKKATMSNHFAALKDLQRK